jgi:fumarate hydratase subunit alpha
VGIGIGSSFDGVALLAKKALLREVGSQNPDPRLADVERRILERINGSGIGPGGTGGRVTALGVAVETAPCHMASFPVAVNVSCHVLRSASAEL